MSNKAYIESGMLESYALGMCSADEATEVEGMCNTHSEIKVELLDTQEAINAYALTQSKAPKAETREKILTSILLQTQISQDEKAKIIPLYNNRLAVAASFILLSLSLLGNIFFYQKWKSANGEILALNSEKQQLADNMNANQVKYELMQRDMSIITNPDVVKVMMKGLEKSPESLAMIYWNTKSKEVFIELKSLPSLDVGKQYQLWAIVDGKPVDAGMIALNTNGDTTLHKMKEFETAQAFAITIEKEGGSPTPTSEAMVVLGGVIL